MIGLYVGLKLGDVLRARQPWTIICLIIVFYMISGNIWNHIRRPPYSSGREGGIMSISPSMGFQFGVESYIVSALYFLCGFPLWLLVQRVPYVESDGRQRTLVYLCMAAFIFFFGILLRVFRIKYPHYPFTLF
jgi:oligosaccharyltransferase complex subunit gamma